MKRKLIILSIISFIIYEIRQQQLRVHYIYVKDVESEILKKRGRILFKVTFTDDDGNCYKGVSRIRISKDDKVLCTFKKHGYVNIENVSKSFVR